MEIVLPAMGEGITDATITKWFKKTGDVVEEDEVIAEVSTDKVDSEITAPSTGIISEIVREEGETVEIGAVLAILTPRIKHIKEKDDKNDIKTTGVYNLNKAGSKRSYLIIEPRTNLKKHMFVPPFIRNLASDYNIPPKELYSVKGSGKDGAINRQDIINYIINRKKLSRKEQQDIQISTPSRVKSEGMGSGNTNDEKYNANKMDNVEIIKMDKMRKIISSRMVHSKQVSPHATIFIEADVTDLVHWRNKTKNVFMDKYGVRLTFTSLFIEAIISGLKAYPYLNASVQDDNIILKKDMNIGVATALQDGNLIVPVIKHTQNKNLVGIATSVEKLVNKARKNKLSPSEIQGGTFTITNLGNFEGQAGTPIINQPEVAILGTGAITRKPGVVQTPQGETLGIRDMITLSLSFDHRLIDGAIGGMFLKHIKNSLANINSNRPV